MNLQQLFDRYQVARSIEPTTVVSYQATINVFNRWLAVHDLAGISVSDIDYDLLNSFLNEYSKGVSERTTNSKRRILIALLNFFLEPQRESINSKFVKHRKVRDTKKTSWQPSEVKRMIHFAGYLPGTLANGTTKSDYFQCLLSVAWETAARRGDLSRITTDEVSSRKPFLFVQHKTGTGVVYTLSEATINAVLEMPHCQESKVAFPPWTASRDRRWHLESITKTCREIMQAAGLTAFDGCLKKLRRSAITRAEELKPGSGYKFAGHTDPRTTIKSYLDPTRAESARLEAN